MSKGGFYDNEKPSVYAVFKSYPQLIVFIIVINIFIYTKKPLYKIFVDNFSACQKVVLYFQNVKK